MGHHLLYIEQNEPWAISGQREAVAKIQDVAWLHRIFDEGSGTRSCHGMVHPFQESKTGTRPLSRRSHGWKDCWRSEHCIFTTVFEDTDPFTLWYTPVQYHVSRAELTAQSRVHAVDEVAFARGYGFIRSDSSSPSALPASEHRHRGCRALRPYPGIWNTSNVRRLQGRFSPV